MQDASGWQSIRERGITLVIDVRAAGVKHALYGAHSSLIRALSVLDLILVDAEAPSHHMDKAGRPDILCVYKFPVVLEDSIDASRQAHVVARRMRGAGDIARLDFYHLSIEKV